ncbi:MAG: MmgE/PrpD family protein [Defluviicoccus sp.]|nr:MmgE/PrpD family protein [Defluviicoccus sp.]MDE0385807.1 MmgE/PrpD family protein [Defluviicoccus sp.]
MSRETTERLAGFAATLRLDAVPEDVRQAAKALLLDALACALAGHRGEETGQVRALASALGASAESAVIGGGGMSLAGATLMNGYLITAVTMCDVHRATLTHVTPEIVPPALAVAARDDASGADLLAAVIAGLEVMTRVGLGLDYPAFRAKGWHGPGVTGPFGAAAACGRLLGFDADRMARAFGLAGSQSAGTFAAWGTPTVKWHQCRAALSGLMAALLAEQGFSAARNFLTAPDGGLYATYADGGLPELATRDLGRRWELQQIALRLWPAATALQDVLTALAGLADDVAFADVARVRLALPKVAFDMHGGFAAYKAKFEALLSAHYVAAVYLRDRRLTLDQFEPDCYDDPALRRFAAERVEVVLDPELSGGQAVAEIGTATGARRSARCAHALGTPQNPLSRAQVEEKFRTYAEPVLGPRRTDRTIAAVGALEQLASSRELASWLGAREEAS